jgi:hypothetical protein
MALRSAFWFSLAGLVTFAPQPSSADTFFVFAGGYALDTTRHCASVGSDTSATCDATNTSTDASTGETKSGTVDVAADLTSGNLMVHAESMASLPTAQAGGEAQIGDTLTFAGAIAHGSTTTVTMTGTMSDSNSGGGSDSFAGGALEVFDPDTGLLTSGGACSRPTSGFICDPTNDQTQVSVVGDSFSISSTANISLHSKILVEFVVVASTFLTGSADISDPITIDLPPGVTFTSASGKFLTGAGGGSVPETSTWTMILAGFASLAVLACRSRCRTAASSA